MKLPASSLFYLSTSILLLILMYLPNFTDYRMKVLCAAIIVILGIAVYQKARGSKALSIKELAAIAVCTVLAFGLNYLTELNMVICVLIANVLFTAWALLQQRKT